MTRERLYELKAECTADLSLAREYNRKPWVVTLTKRLDFLNGIEASVLRNSPYIVPSEGKVKC